MIFLVEQYSDKYDCVISADEGGFVEYWQPAEPFTLPKNVPRLWNYKSETDLYEFKKVSITFYVIIHLLTYFSADKIHTNLYNPISRFLFLRHLFLSRSPSPCLLFPYWQAHAEIRRIT